MSSVTSPDRLHDLSLRMMTLGVVVLLTVCAGFLAWRQFRPPAPVTPVAAPALAESFPVRAPEPYQTRSLPDPQILRAPDKVFRCAQRGRVVYSDQACPQGDERVMSVTKPGAGSQSLHPETAAPSAARPASR
jgi:hypothetical protein